MNDDAHGTYNTNSQIKFKTTMLKSTLDDYSHEYILVKGTITAAFVEIVAFPNNRDKSNI